MDIYEDGIFLVTGGTGSFGQTMTRHLLAKGAREVRVFSRDEAKQDLMRTELAGGNVRFYIGDVRDYHSVERALRGVDYIFHAAALKQVPSCEFFPMQAVMTNVAGSDNVLRAAFENGVRRVVCLSTDKAVYPINAMGISKAMMEKVAQSYARGAAGDDPVVTCVRYGNVMCSRGSVIPRFIGQIKAGRPLTLTNPAMTRFLMALSESVELVELAFTHGQPGDVFVKKAPACTVGDLAMALQNLFGVAHDRQIIGVRHGEKLYETLASKEELARAEDCGSHYRIGMDERDLNYEKYFTEGNPAGEPEDDYHSHNTERLDVAAVERVLLGLGAVQAELATWQGCGE